MNVYFTAAAYADLKAIGSWIAEDNPSRSVSFTAELREACIKIADAPRGYVVVQRYRDREIRRKPFGDYLIFYRIKADSIDILHIVHGHRDIRNLF